MSEGDMKPLSDLRVVELRAELEKRGLDRSGNKQTLVERLQKVGFVMATFVLDARVLFVDFWFGGVC